MGYYYYGLGFYRVEPGNLISPMLTSESSWSVPISPSDLSSKLKVEYRSLFLAPLSTLLNN